MEEQINSNEDTMVITSEKIDELKQRYSQELKDSPDNPMKVCMGLIFSGGIEKDPAKRATISRELSEFLTKPDGIINLFIGLIDFDTTSEHVTTHNQRFVAIANIITCLPKLCMPYEDYCENISKQLKPLLIDQDPKYSSLASIIIKALIDSPHAGREKQKIRIMDLITKPILSPFYSCTNTNYYQLDQAIVAIHNIISNNLLIELFIGIFPNLILALQTFGSSPSILKTPLKSILISMLNNLSPGAACCLIEKTLFHCNIKSDLYVICPRDSGISILTNPTPDPESDCPSFSTNTILDLIESCDNEMLVLEFYFHFQNTIWTAKEQKQREFSAALIEPFLEDSSQEDNCASKFDIFQIIAKNRQKSLELITRTLLNHKTYLTSSSEDQATRLKHIDQSTTSCISILEVLCATICDKSDEVVLMTRCQPVLSELNQTLGNISDARAEPIKRAIDSFLKKIEGQTSEGIDIKITHAKQREFASIIKDLDDKLVPVRVHALVRIKQLVLSNDPFILPKIPQVYSMIECSLADEEPYVFLASINLLAEMAVRNTTFVLPKLIDLYARHDIELQNRINVGEVLIRLVKQLNETTPFYAQQVMDCLLLHCKDPEELMRMSSLVNIGEICKNLGSSLSRYFVEILACIRSILDTDTVQVKCAAVHLLCTALSGADLLAIEAIQRDLKEIYGILKRLRGVTLDEKLRLQIDLALDEIDRIAREMLGAGATNSDKNTKNIKVLSLL